MLKTNFVTDPMHYCCVLELLFSKHRYC